MYVWDLHELPLVFMGNPIKRQLFRYLESKCNVMIHANESRLKHLEKIEKQNDRLQQYLVLITALLEIGRAHV